MFVQLDLVAAYWVLNLLRGEDLPGIAISCLECGLDSESLRILASEPETPMRDLNDLLRRCLADHSVAIPTARDAAIRIAIHHAQEILDSSVSPYEGAKSIVNEIYYAFDDPIPELVPFMGLEDQYADFYDEFRINYYGEEHCSAVRADIERQIIGAAKDLLEHYA